MSKYRFIGNPDDYSSDFKIKKGDILDSEYVPADWRYNIQGAVISNPNDWELVEDESNNIQPNHYKGNGIQPIDLIESMNMSFNQGNIIKYVSRYKNKNGLEDLQKAKFYLERLILEEQNKQ